MNGSKIGADLRLLFMAVWLTFWSVGVAVIQTMVLGLFAAEGLGGLGVFAFVPLVFLITHGGSEVFVQRQVSRQVRENAERPSRTSVGRDVGGEVVRWRRGSPTVIQWVATYLLPVLTLGILLVPALLTVSMGAGVLPMILASLFGLAWVGIMGQLWWPTWQTQARSTDALELQVEAHQITLTERTTTGTREHRFPTHAVRVETGESTEVRRLVAGDVVWEGRLPEEARKVLDQARPRIEAARVGQAGAVPEELERLRRGSAEKQPS